MGTRNRSVAVSSTAAHLTELPDGPRKRTWKRPGNFKSAEKAEEWLKSHYETDFDFTDISKENATAIARVWYELTGLFPEINIIYVGNYRSRIPMDMKDWFEEIQKEQKIPTFVTLHDVRPQIGKWKGSPLKADSDAYLTPDDLALHGDAYHSFDILNRIADGKRIDTENLPYEANSYAHCIKDLGVIGLNPVDFESTELINQNLENSRKNGTSPPGCKTVEYVIAHEFCHAIDHWIQENLKDYYFADWSGYQKYDTSVVSVWNRVKASFKKKEGDLLCNYARDSFEKNPESGEPAAEAFATRYEVKDPVPYARLVNNFIDTVMEMHRNHKLVHKNDVEFHNVIQGMTKFDDFLKRMGF